VGMNAELYQEDTLCLSFVRQEAESSRRVARYLCLGFGCK